MIRLELQPDRGEFTLHVDDDGIQALRESLDDAAAGAKVFLGDPGALLIIRPDGFESRDGGEGRDGAVRRNGNKPSA